MCELETSRTYYVLWKKKKKLKIHNYDRSLEINLIYEINIEILKKERGNREMQ